jgi:hypothetical protein
MPYWNDAPVSTKQNEEAKRILDNVDKPSGSVMATLSQSMDEMKNNMQV